MLLNSVTKTRSIPLQLSILLLFCSLIALFLTGINRGSPYGHLGINLGISYFIGFSIWSISKLIEHFGWIKGVALRAVVSVVTGTLLGGFVGYLMFLDNVVPYPNRELLRILLLGLGFGAVALYIVISQTTIYQRREQLALERTMRAEQQQQLTQSRLDTLQAQIEPHFLFNTLANIDSCIDSTPDVAREMLGRLTQLLRRGLKTDGAPTTVESELSLIDDYLAIQKFRLGARLDYTISIDGDVAECKIAPLLIQPLVENAVIHGIESRVADGQVTIGVVVQGEDLCVSVTDDGVGIGNSRRPGSGMALHNIRERLQTLYGGSATLSLREDSDGRTLAQITIPQQRAE